MKKLNLVFSNKNQFSPQSNVSLDTLDEGTSFATNIRHIAILIALCFCIVFTSCKSVPSTSFINPVDLLDEKSAFYLAIPKKADEALVSRMISMYIPQLSEKNIKSITDRTNNIYCGINKSRKGTTIQAAIEGNIPTFYIPRILSKKNGWTKRSYENPQTKSSYVIYSLNNIEISFPSNNIALIGRDIEEMLDRFDYLKSIPQVLSETESSIVAPKVIDEVYETSELFTEIKSYLKDAVEEIRFYANQPKSFLSVLTGEDLDLKLIDVSGSFKCDPRSDKQYILNIYLNFKEKKYLKAGRALLSLVFGLTGADTNIVDNRQLQVTGIEINKQQLYKILAI